MHCSTMSQAKTTRKDAATTNCGHENINIPYCVCAAATACRGVQHTASACFSRAVHALHEVLAAVSHTTLRIKVIQTIAWTGTSASTNTALGTALTATSAAAQTQTHLLLGVGTFTFSTCPKSGVYAHWLDELTGWDNCYRPPPRGHGHIEHTARCKGPKHDCMTDPCKLPPRSKADIEHAHAHQSQGRNTRQEHLACMLSSNTTDCKTTGYPGTRMLVACMHAKHTTPLQLCRRTAVHCQACLWH
jgi:hypothetical protein